MSGTIKEVTLSVCVFIARIFVEIVVLAVIFLRSAPFFSGLLSTIASTKVLLLAIIIICLRFSGLIPISVVAIVFMCSSTRTLIWRVILRVAGAIVLLFYKLIGEDIISSSYLLKSFFILLCALFALNCVRVVLLGYLVELSFDLILSCIAFQA